MLPANFQVFNLIAVVFFLYSFLIWKPEAKIVNVTSHEYNDLEEGYPTNCHVCKFLVDEIYIYMKSTFSHDVVQLGSIFQNRVKKVKYDKTELRLIETLEEACQKMLEYKVHKDRPIRYSRKQSETFSTLHGLRKRGVKVDLGFPVEMWDDPDREVQVMKQKCEQLVEDYEEDLSNWYFKHREKNLTQWLCAEKVLKGQDQECLDIGFVDIFKNKVDGNSKQSKDDREKIQDAIKKQAEKQQSETGQSRKDETDQKSKVRKAENDINKPDIHQEL